MGGMQLGVRVGVLEAVDDDILARVVVMSASLGSEAIIDFMHALTTVSLEELSGKPTPRVFALSKIVEACHHNMMRPRIVWTILWKGGTDAAQAGDGWRGLSEYFVDIGCHENLQVAMYAMDALRQVPPPDMPAACCVLGPHWPRSVPPQRLSTICRCRGDVLARMCCGSLLGSVWLGVVLFWGACCRWASMYAAYWLGVCAAAPAVCCLR